MFTAIGVARHLLLADPLTSVVAVAVSQRVPRRHPTAYVALATLVVAGIALMTVAGRLPTRIDPPSSQTANVLGACLYGQHHRVAYPDPGIRRPAAIQASPQGLLVGCSSNAI